MQMDSLQIIYFLVISIIILIVLVRRKNNDDYIQINKTISIIIILFPVTFITSFFNGSQSLLALRLYDLLIPFIIMLVTTVVLFILGEDKFFKTFSYSVVIVAAIFSLLGMMEIAGIRLVEFPTMIPPGSTLGHRGFAAEYLAAALPFFIIANSFVKKDYKALLLAGFFICLTFLFFTRSRSALLISGVLLILYLLIIVKWYKKESIRKLIPVVSVAASAFIISMLPIQGMQRSELSSTAASIIDTDYRSNKLRLSFWNASLEMIKENPFSGIGLYKWSGVSSKYLGDYFNDDSIYFVHNVHAHNEFLEMFAENGIITPLVYILFLLVLFRNIYEKGKRNRNYYWLLLSAAATVLFSLVSFPLYKFSSYFLFACIIGTALISESEEGKSNFKIKLSNAVYTGIILIGVGIIITYVRLKSELNFVAAISLNEMKAYELMIEKLNNVSQTFYPYDASKQPVDYYRGIAEYHLNRYDETLKYDLNAHELAPYSPTVMQNLAGCYIIKGNLSKAAQEYEKLREYFPKYINPQIKLLHLYTSTSERNLEKGRKLLEELLKKKPDDPQLLKVKQQYY